MTLEALRAWARFANVSIAPPPPFKSLIVNRARMYWYGSIADRVWFADSEEELLGQMHADWLKIDDTGSS